MNDMKIIAKYRHPAIDPVTMETSDRNVADDETGALHYMDIGASHAEWEYAGIGATVESLRPSPEHCLVELNGEIILTSAEVWSSAAYRAAVSGAPH